MAAAVVDQRSKEWLLFEVLHLGCFSAPSVRYLTAHFRVVPGIDLQGGGLQRTFIVLHQGGVDLHGNYYFVDLTSSMDRGGWCHCKESDT